MNFYSTSKIYCIVDNTSNHVYIGSTTRALDARLESHLIDYEKFLGGSQKYMTSFDIFKNNDYRIELLEEVNCTCKQELVAVERKYIETMECVNKVVPGRSMKEYRLANKEKIAMQDKAYYQKNKERIRDRKNANPEQLRAAKKKYESKKVNCECGATVCRGSLNDHVRTVRHMLNAKRMAALDLLI